MIKDIYHEIKELRSLLHNNPEVSNQELKTKEILMDYLKNRTHFEIHNLGNSFYAYRKADIQTDENIAFRADYDAVKIAEDNIGHYCGHDGHSASLAGFLKLIDDKPISKNIYAIFQSGEEIGKGAYECINNLKDIKIDEIYGYHNIPGYDVGTVLLKKNTFACASNGMIIRLKGAVSHAAYPDSGKNPAYALAKIISFIEDINHEKKDYIEFITVVGNKMGDKSFGVSCGDAEIYITLRSEIEESLNRLNNRIIDKVKELSDNYGLVFDYEFIEAFPETRNHNDYVNKIEDIAEDLHLKISNLNEAFHWSEDFGYYLKDIKGAFFGIGDGKDTGDLHTINYKFNDKIMIIIWMIYYNLVK